VRRPLPARKLWALGAVACPLLALLALQGEAAQQGAPGNDSQDSRISVDVNLVVVHATVSDRQGHPISGLEQRDFEVYEDGVPQPIRVFAHEDVPVTAGLVVDHSGSMRRKLAEVSAAARTFVELSNPDDRMFVVNFNEHVFLGLPKDAPFTASAAELELAISRAPATGKTALYDGIAKALDQMTAAPLDKKVLIVISDGGDNASQHTLAQVLKLAEQSSAIIYAVGIYDNDDPDRNPKVLRSLASATGGIAFFSDDMGELSAFCTRIAHDIRAQYTIGYAPSKPAQPGDYRAIRVVAKSAHHGKLSVRARTGYLVAGAPRPAAIEQALR
jgi:Ca-activated chloride channel family protein